LRGQHPRQLITGVDAEFLVDVAQVVLDGLRAQEQRGGGFPGGLPPGQQEGDLQLLRGQLVEGARDRAALGYGDNERVCIVTVGGSAVGAPLLRRVIASFPQAKEQVPDLRMIVVAGPRIDPAVLSGLDGLPGMPGRGGRAGVPGLEIRPYVPDLYRHLAVCDLAVVQGGLTTTMELTANQRPFLYFPLGHHFEQTIHVRHRLGRYRAGRCMDYETSGPAEIAAAIATEIGREVDYRPVAPDGAARAAALLADLL